MRSGDADGRTGQNLLSWCECPSAGRTVLPTKRCFPPTARPASTAMPAGATVCGKEVGIQLIRDCVDGHQRADDAAMMPTSPDEVPCAHAASANPWGINWQVALLPAVVTHALSSCRTMHYPR